jgi:hypothetical protein
MKWIYSLLVLALCSLLASGCYTKKQAVRKFCTPTKEISKDSTFHSINTSSSSYDSTLDSLIVYPSVIIETIFQPCDSFGRIIEGLNLQLRSGTGTLTVKSEGGRIKVTLNCDSTVSHLRREIHTKDSTIRVLQVHDKSVVKIPPVEIREVLKWWVKPALIILGLLSLPSIFFIIKKLILPKP